MSLRYTITILRGTIKKIGVLLSFSLLSGFLMAQSDPGVGSLAILDLNDNPVTASQLKKNETYKIRLAIGNYSSNPLHAGCAEVRIGLGDLFELAPGFNLATAPLSDLFNWSTFTGGDQFEIVGMLITDITIADQGVAEFEVKAIDDTGSSFFNNSFNITNAGGGCGDSESNTGNNTANLDYTVINPLAITCQDATIMLDENGEGAFDEDDLVSNYIDMTGTGVFTFDPSSPFDCGDLGTVSVTVTLTDDLGNSENCTSTVTVEDNIAPTIVGCPSNMGPLDMDAGLCGAAVTWTDPTATDNCDESVTVVRTDETGLNSGDVFPEGVTIISYSATDTEGNSSTCSFMVTVNGDGEAPVISGCPTDMGPLDMDAGLCGTVVTWTAPTATDNCDESVTVVRTDATGLNSGDVFPEGVTVISYSATDTEGNSSTCSFMVTVNADGEAPVISGCPTDMGPLDMDAGLCGTVVTWTDPTATDNCDESVTVVRTDATGLNSGDVFPEGVTIISYNATDTEGNSSTCSFMVTVNPDGEAPIVTIIGDETIIVECNTDYEDAGATASDNCDGDVTGVIDVDNPVDENVPGEYTVTYTVMDAAGNTGTATRTVIIQGPETCGACVTTRVVEASELAGTHDDVFYASQLIISNGVITVGENIEFRSDETELLQGFEVELGAEFAVYNDPCVPVENLTKDQYRGLMQLLELKKKAEKKK